MNNFSEKLETLEYLVFEEENLLKAQNLVVSMISDANDNILKEDFVEFLSTAADAIEDIESSQVYDDVTRWALKIYSQQKDSGDLKWLETADALINWLNKRLELIEDPAEAKESKLSLNLFNDVIKKGGISDDDKLTNDYQGYATYSLIVGLNEKSSLLIDQAIAAQRKVLQLYQNGKFPDYYNLKTFVAGAKRRLAETLMAGLEFDKDVYSKYTEEIGELLLSTGADFKYCGTNFDREYNNQLIHKYENIVR